MSKYPSARELVNKALGKKLSPNGQAVLDALKASLPADPLELRGTDTFAASNDSSTGPTTNPPNSANPADHGEVPNEAPPTDRQTRKLKLLHLIEAKLAEAATSKPKRTKPKPSTRAQVNRANSENATGPKSPEGKAKASANSLKHGFFANVEKLNPYDSALYQETYHDLRMGLQPDGPVEEHLIRELATLSARLQRLEAAEYALLLGNIEADLSDTRELATAFQKAATPLDQLHKAELHLRRAYNRTWDRLERMQKERHKLPLNISLERSQRWLTYYHQKENPSQPPPPSPPQSNVQPPPPPPSVPRSSHPGPNPVEVGSTTSAESTKSPKSQKQGSIHPVKQ